MLYSFGLWESTKATKLEGKDGKYIIDSEGDAEKVREVITPCGEFAQGKEINKIIRDFANYLCIGNHISSYYKAKI